jgi:hypothetical protein
MDFTLDYQKFTKDKVGVNPINVKPGQVIEFLHKNQSRIGLVLNPKYQGKLHLIKLNELAFDTFERAFRSEIKNLINISDENIAAQVLYQKAKPYIKAYDCYRSYLWENVRSVFVLELQEGGELTEEEYTAEEVVEDQQYDLTQENQ